MRIPTPLNRLCPLLWLLAVLTQSVFASDEDRWYRVELLVFSNEATRTNELFEPTPTLEYPNAARFLVEPQRVRARIEEHPDSRSALDEFGRQIFTPIAVPVESELEPDSEPAGRTSVDILAAALPAEPPPLDANEAVDPNEVVAAEEAGPSLPTPFVVLPDEQLEFRSKAAYMQRSGRYHILFHAAWLQAVPDEPAALPIILDHSGDTGQWPRLQGSITLFLARYLHVSTNLWLNTSGDYLGDSDWRMPAPPLGPPAVIVEELPVPPALEDAAIVLDTVPIGPENRAIRDPNQPEPGTFDPSQSPTRRAVLSSSALPSAAAVAADDAMPADPNEFPPEEIAIPEYPFRHAVLLQQQRRMRSGEVHYIDHPLFGVVIKLTPLTEEELAEAARAEMVPG